MRRIIFSLMVGMLVLLGSVGSAQAAWFFDGFDYAVDGRLEDHAPWVMAHADSPADQTWNVGPTWAGRARLEDNHWAGDWTLMIAEGTNVPVPGAAPVADYLVSFDAFAVPAYSHFDGRRRMYAVGRYLPGVGGAASEWVAARFTVQPYGHTGGWATVTVQLRDSTGAATGDYYVAHTVPDINLVGITLEMAGTTLTATATYGVHVTTVTAETTIVNTGSPGFAANFPWGFTSAEVDNFTVIPEPATMILLGMGLLAGVAGLKKKRA